ncbi:copper-binding protein [Zavarzinella formosa]|uniref:copper-binding protein n=1 Tax=Zavarzinella formosa TaxID=360055 RepID=UPI0002F03B34|nr:copper-binding protein [Zavarzinella formosa]
MISPFKFIAVGLVLILALSGCQQSPSTNPSGKEAGKIYDVKGKVVSVDAANKRVKLDHEDIPGLMKAMKMEFTVEDAKLLEGLKAGDEVRGTLRSGGGNTVITSFQKR